MTERWRKPRLMLNKAKLGAVEHIEEDKSFAGSQTRYAKEVFLQ